jgi:hypothetical protein
MIRRGGSAPLFLNKVNSDKKALEVTAVLDACHPTHSERLWLCGFLKFCGYSMAEVLDSIREHAQWRHLHRTKEAGARQIRIGLEEAKK